jgi:multisubunit Na+/H+ antiporter MnhC subunit
MQTANSTARRLRTATLLAIFGTSYIFLSRSIGTFSPAIFKQIHVVQASLLLSMLASATMVVFLICLYGSYLQMEQTRLRKATLLAIIGTCAVLALYVKGLFLVFDLSIYPHPFWSSHFETIVPWASSIFMLVFFIAFFKEPRHKTQESLKRATLLAIMGSVILASLRTVVFLNFFYSGKFLWVPQLIRETPVILFPLFAFGFCTIIYFLIIFHREYASIA